MLNIKNQLIKKQPKISVIVPIYNKELYIEKCVKSILEQTLNEIEIILVDDGSTDNSLKIISTYKDPRIKILRQKNKGASSARNSAIKISKGDYIAFVDADDYLRTDMYEILYNRAIKEKADIICCQFKKLDIYDEVLYETKLLDNNFFENILLNKDFSVLWNKIIKKDLFFKNNIYIPEKIIFEDVGTIYKLFFYSKKTILVNEHLYFWVQNNGSLTESFSKKHIHSMFIVLLEMFNFIKMHNLSSKYFESYLLKFFFSVDFLFNRVNTHCKKFSLAKEFYKLIFENLEKSVLFNDKNLDKLKLINFGLYHKIKFFILNKHLLTNLNKSQLSLILKNLSINEDEMILTEEDLIQNLLIKKRILYNNKIEEFVKLNFSMRLNILFKEINSLKTLNKKFAIYGNGLIGNIIAKELQKDLIIIFDQNDKIQSEYANVVLPSEIKNYTFDILIISVFGRENLIKENFKEVNFQILEMPISKSENL